MTNNSFSPFLGREPHGAAIGKSAHYHYYPTPFLAYNTWRARPNSSSSVLTPSESSSSPSTVIVHTPRNPNDEKIPCDMTAKLTH
jgi:hypothetical protein